MKHGRVSILPPELAGRPLTRPVPESDLCSLLVSALSGKPHLLHRPNDFRA